MQYASGVLSKGFCNIYISQRFFLYVNVCLFVCLFYQMNYTLTSYSIYQHHQTNTVSSLHLPPKKLWPVWAVLAARLGMSWGARIGNQLRVQFCAVGLNSVSPSFSCTLFIAEEFEFLHTWYVQNLFSYCISTLCVQIKKKKQSSHIKNNSARFLFFLTENIKNNQLQ